MSGTWIHQFQLQFDQKFFNLWCMFLGSNLIVNLCFFCCTLNFFWNCTLNFTQVSKPWCNIICSLQQIFLSFFFTITSSFSFVKLLVDITCPWCLFFLWTDESLRTQPVTENVMFSLYFWFLKCQVRVDKNITLMVHLSSLLITCIL